MSSLQLEVGKMTFVEAVAALRQGMQVRRGCWVRTLYLTGDGTGGVHWGHTGDPYILDLDHVEAEDWEVIEHSVQVTRGQVITAIDMAIDKAWMTELETSKPYFSLTLLKEELLRGLVLPTG